MAVDGATARAVVVVGAVVVVEADVLDEVLDDVTVEERALLRALPIWARHWRASWRQVAHWPLRACARARAQRWRAWTARRVRQRVVRLQQGQVLEVVRGAAVLHAPV